MPSKAPARTAPKKFAVPSGRFRKVEKSKSKGGKSKLNLKKWLQTPEDWARFDAWAKVNAQPRKAPEPEPIIRQSKPLHQLKKRIQFLARPPKRPDVSVHFNLDFRVSKAALKFVASRRLDMLSWAVIRKIDCGRKLPVKVSRAALKYEPTERITALSQPKIFVREECKSFEISEKALTHETTDRERRLALAKKLVECPEGLTEKEREELFTPAGVRRSAFTYKITPWVEILSLPPYKKLIPRDDEDAVKWKQLMLDEQDRRGKIAIEEQRRKREEARGQRSEAIRKRGDDEDREEGEEGEETVAKEESQQQEREETEEIDEETRKRKLRKNAWKFEPSPCKDDPFDIKKSALKGEASPRVQELAKARFRKSTAYKLNPFKVKQSTLKATASEKLEMLAKPPRPLSPVERRAPREKDEYGRPIFKKPIYGKRLPRTKPYKMGEYVPVQKKQPRKRKPIDPIVYQPTIDPCIDPWQAEKQKKERKRAMKLMKKIQRQRKDEEFKETDLQESAYVEA